MRFFVAFYYEKLESGDNSSERTLTTGFSCMEGEIPEGRIETLLPMVQSIAQGGKYSVVVPLSIIPLPIVSSNRAQILTPKFIQ